MLPVPINKYNKCQCYEKSEQELIQFEDQRKLKNMCYFSYFCAEVFDMTVMNPAKREENFITLNILRTINAPPPPPPSNEMQLKFKAAFEFLSHLRFKLSSHSPKHIQASCPNLVL